MKKDFINIADLTKDEIYEIFDLCKDLKEKTKKGIEHHIIKGKSMSMILPNHQPEPVFHLKPECSSLADTLYIYPLTI